MNLIDRDKLIEEIKRESVEGIIMKKARLNIKFVKHKMIDLNIESIKELADRLEENSRSVNEWFFKGKKRKVSIPNPRTLAKFIELFECDFNDLLEIVEVEENVG